MPRSARLTDRERQCLELLGTGSRRADIGQRLGISLGTVDLHIANAKRKLRARTREEALVKAVQFKLIVIAF